MTEPKPTGSRRTTRSREELSAENLEGDQSYRVEESVTEEFIDADGERVAVTETTTTSSTVDLPGTEPPPDVLRDARRYAADANSGDNGDAFEEPAPVPVALHWRSDNHVNVNLGRTALGATRDLPLWWAIEESTRLLSFNNYLSFMDYMLCGGALPQGAIGSPEDEEMVRELTSLGSRVQDKGRSLAQRRFLPFTDTDAYRLLKVATEAFVSVNCASIEFQGGTISNREQQWWRRAEEAGLLEGKDISGNVAQIRSGWYSDYLQRVHGTSTLIFPYLAVIRRKLSDAPIKSAIFRDDTSPSSARQREERCYGILREKLATPCLTELIWSYWHEQGMLVQSMNAISRRFQNIRGPEQDPLAMMELDPLRPLNNLLWGYIQDEQHRLTVLRRAYEYDHHYGLTLEGRAVPQLRTADSRSKFLDSFHNLLYLCAAFYKQDDDTTFISDAFPILIALRDLHMQLAEGAHNQFGDLPTTARIEMLMQQWLLARPEFREVLPTRIMVDYPEPWMDRVDAMKRLQGWPGANVMHFRDLGRFGEQVLLTVRFGNWNDADRNQAKVWARYWRSAIQSYIHAYRIVTSVDLTADVTQPQQRSLIATQPSVLMRSPQVSALPGAPQLPPLTSTSNPRFRERRPLRNP